MASSIVSLLWQLAFLYVFIKYLVPWGVDIAKELPSLIPSGGGQQQPIDDSGGGEDIQTDDSNGGDSENSDSEESNYGTILDNITPINWV